MACKDLFIYNLRVNLMLSSYRKTMDSHLTRRPWPSTHSIHRGKIMTNNITLPHHAIASRVSDGEIMQQTRRSRERRSLPYLKCIASIFDARERDFSRKSSRLTFVARSEKRVSAFNEKLDRGRWDCISNARLQKRNSAAITTQYRRMDFLSHGNQRRRNFLQDLFMTNCTSLYFDNKYYR